MTISKKLLSVVMAVIMVFSVCSVTASANDEVGGSYYEQGDYSIHYNVVSAQGEQKGRILFIHGFLYSGTTWNGVAEIMSAKGYDCYLVDLPNFGYSTRENKNTNIVDREDLMVGLMETVAPLDEWIVAGHSMGGGVAMNIACDHPEIEALMLFCPSEVYMNGNSLMTRLAASELLGKLMDSMFKVILSSELIVKAAVYFATGDMEYAKNYDTALLAEPLMISGTGTGMLYGSVIARNTDTEKVAALTTPTLLVWAKGDNVISDDIKANISNALTSAETAEIDGSHIVIETNPDTVAGLALDFLEK